MHITRRKSLALIGSAVAAPLILRADEAAAATFERVFTKTLGSAAAGIQDHPRLAGFNSDGSILATWTSGTGSTITTWCQYFSKTGAKFTDPIQLDTAASLAPGTSREARPLSFADGRALIFFFAKRTGAPSTEGDQLFVQRMSADRQKSGEPIRINGDPDGESSSVFAAELTNGNVMVIWARRDHTPPFDGYVVSRVITADGALVTERQRATQPESGAELPTSIAALSGGRSVFAYSHTDFGAGTITVACQRLDANGAPLGNPIILKTTSTSEAYGSGAVASRLSTGSKGRLRALGNVFDVAFYRKTGTLKWKVWAGRYSASGAVVVAPREVWTKAEHAPSAFAQNVPGLISLAAGQSLIIEESNNSAEGRNKILAQVGNIASAGRFQPGHPLLSVEGFLAMDAAMQKLEEGSGEEELAVGAIKAGVGGTDLLAFMGVWVTG
jgi:hypothetical protein